MRVHVVDAAAYTPPYDRALAAALARAGASVELWTSAFGYGEVPGAPAVEVRESFYRWAPGIAGSRVRRIARLAQHVPDTLRYARAARAADVVHYQWLPVQALDARLLARVHPRLLTAHDVLPREPRRGQLAGQRALYERMDAIVVHSEHGAARLRGELGLDPALVHVIPHGPLTELTAQPEDAVPPPELTAGVAPFPEPAAGAVPAAAADPAAPPRERAATGGGGHPAPAAAPAPAAGPVVLCFGLLRPYKGVDVLLEAWRRARLPAGARLWIAGMPRMDVTALRGAAGPHVRFALRFISGAELAATFRAADLVVLPYREIDQSGVLFTALAFGRPLLLSAVGGFPEIAATGAAELVPPGDPDALAGALETLLADPERRARLAAAACAAGAPGGPFGWDAIARRTLALYSALGASTP